MLDSVAIEKLKIVITKVILLIYKKLKCMIRKFRLLKWINTAIDRAKYYFLLLINTIVIFV